MAKKRSCRRTVNEDKVHEKAVKIRKMTDEQLVQYVNDRVEKARSEGLIRERNLKNQRCRRCHNLQNHGAFQRERD